MPEVVEITTFKLNGHSFADFIAANADIDAWLQHSPGFMSRRRGQGGRRCAPVRALWKGGY